MRYTLARAFILIIFSGFSRETLQPINREGVKYFGIEWDSVSALNLKTVDDKPRLMISTETDVAYDLDMTDYIVYSGHSIPLIEITTEQPMEQIPDKINYQDASISIKGFGEYDDFKQNVKIRGRGNSSWKISDKKPYRLKFDKKESLCRLKKAKSYVLSANWSDVSLMQNPIASFLGKMYNVPFTHEMIPVDVVLNGKYRGSYILTHKPGINAGSVDIDESSSVMWELDINYDEDRKFMSPILNLPVMLSDPDDMDDETFEYWKQDFIEMEKGVSEGRVADYIDVDEYVRYRMVYFLLRNNDIGFPKSFKLYKTKGGKYNFGPLWDFDVAMGFDWEDSYMPQTSGAYFWANPLMDAIEQDPYVKNLIKSYLLDFLSRKNELFDYIETYRENIRTSALRNNIAWRYENDSREWDDNIDAMINWLERRFRYIASIYN